jgi:hypothetical protein
MREGLAMSIGVSTRYVYEMLRLGFDLFSTQRKRIVSEK